MSEIYNHNNNTLISGTSENDYIYNYDAVSYVTIEAGGGNDTIANHGGEVKIFAEDGDDSIYTDIFGMAYEHATVYGGAGNDIIKIRDHRSLLDGGAGDDVISVYGGGWTENTLQGGTGNDVIYGGGKNIFVYSNGDGDDIFYNVGNGDTISIESNENYSTVASGSDVVMKVGTGSMTLKNAVGKSLEIFLVPKANDDNEQEKIAAAQNLKALIAIGEGTDSVPADPLNEFSKKIAESEFAFIRWFGKVWYAMTKYEHDSDGNVKTDSNGDPVLDTSTSRATINAGYETILKLDDIFKSANKIADGNLNGGEIATELTKIAQGITNITKEIQKLQTVSAQTTFITNTVSSSLGVVSNFISCFSSDGSLTLKIKGIVDGISAISKDCILQGVNGIWKTTRFGTWLATNTAGQKVADFVTSGKLGTVTTVIADIFIGLDKALKNLDRYKIDGVPTSTIVANGIIDAIEGISKTVLDGFVSSQIGVGTDIIFQGLYTLTETIKWSFKHGWTMATGGDASQVKLDLSSYKHPLESIASALKQLITGTTEELDIFNEKDNQKIYTINGNNHITNFGSKCQFYTGAGDDTVFCHEGTSNNYIDAGNDNDSVVIYGASNEVRAGLGADTIIVYSDGNPSSGNAIYGEGGDDKILIDDSRATKKAGKSNTVDGGTGDDILFLQNTRNSNVIFYNLGDGNDTIYGYSIKDTIKINRSEYTKITDGDNIKIKIGEGSITLIDAKGKNPKITQTDIDILPKGLTANKAKTMLTVKNEFRGGVISLADYDESFTKINASGLSATQGIEIVGNASDNSIKGGKGNDTISGESGENKIYGGDGDDIIYGGSGNDVIQGDKGNDILCGGAGSDTLTGNAGNDIFVYEGGDDTITDYKSGQDKIQLVGGEKIIRSTLIGKNILMTTSSGFITVKNGKNQKITVIDSDGNETTNIYPLEILPAGLSYDTSKKILTVGTGYSGAAIDLADFATSVKTVDASAFTKKIQITGNNNGNSLIGGSKTDVLTGGTKADVLTGGKGNDILTGGDGKDTFVYASGDGKDTITDYTAGDKIKISSGTISKTAYSGQNVVFTVGNGSITVRNGKSKKITITDASGRTSTKTYTTGVSYGSNGNAAVPWFTEDDTNFISASANLDEISAEKFSVTNVETPANYENLAQENPIVLVSSNK